MKFNITNKAAEILKQSPEERMTARELAQKVIKAYPEECSQKKERSEAIKSKKNSNLALESQIAAEINARQAKLQKDNSNIKITESYPQKYFFSLAKDSDESEEFSKSDSASLDTTKTKEYERELYVKLEDYLEKKLNVDSKRIDEKRSGNVLGRNGNKWLHPDLVGMENLSKGWTSEIKDCVRLHSDKKMKLWSFEVKREIRRSNVREVFFQAVSNSSWANFGYLVAGDIIKSGESGSVLEELRILSGLHGIGLIRLDAETPLESQILIPAKEKTEIDWNVANRIAATNADFLQYIKKVIDFYEKESSQSREIKGVQGEVAVKA